MPPIVSRMIVFMLPPVYLNGAHAKQIQGNSTMALHGTIDES